MGLGLFLEERLNLRESDVAVQRLRAEILSKDRFSAKERKKLFIKILKNSPEPKMSSHLDTYLDLLMGMDSDRVIGSTRKRMAEDMDYASLMRLERSYHNDILIPQSSYFKVYKEFKQRGLQPGQKVVDLGAAMGRIGLVVTLMFQDVEFLGYELVTERVNAGNEMFEYLGLTDRARIQEKDLSDTELELESADFYHCFMSFNHLTGSNVSRALIDRAKKGDFFVVIGYFQGSNVLQDSRFFRTLDFLRGYQGFRTRRVPLPFSPY